MALSAFFSTVNRSLYVATLGLFLIWGSANVRGQIVAAPAEIIDRDFDQTVLTQLNETISMLRSMLGSLDANERSCMSDVIRTLECLRRSFASNGTGGECRLPGCSSSLLSRYGIDTAEFFTDGAPANSGERGRASGGSTAPISGPGLPISNLPGSSSTSAAPRKSSGSSTSGSRRISRNAPNRTTPGQPRSTTNTNRGNTRYAGSVQVINKPLDINSVRTEPARCVAIESHDRTVQWLYVDAERYKLKEGCNGHFKADNFRVSSWGSNKMFINTYLSAFISNSKGDPSTTGGYLRIYNASSKFPAYFGLSGVMNQKIEPGQTQMIYLPIYRSKNDYRPTVIDVFLRWWEPK